MTNVPPFAAIPSPGIPDILTDPVPDHTATRGNGEKPPTPPMKKTVPRLGENRPKRTDRKITEADKEKIANYYHSIGVPLTLFSPKVGKVIVDNAEQCADAWYELAQENSSVRRALLAMLEGSAWAGLLAAHLPIAVAALPQRMVENNPILGLIQPMVIGEDEDSE